MADDKLAYYPSLILDRLELGAKGGSWLATGRKDKRLVFKLIE